MNNSIALNLYFTSDFAEALVLSTIGVPWGDPNNRCFNFYTPEFLQKQGKTAEQCVAAGIPGKVSWGFRRTNELEAALPLFREVWNLPDGKVPNTDGVSNPDAIRIMALVLKNRSKLAPDFKHATPKVAVARGAGGATTIICPNTDPARLRDMGLTQ